jgi:hypothetical protein
LGFFIEMENTGSFGSAIGGGSAIAEAMSRRGMGGGATNQVSPASATFDPSTQPSPQATNSVAATPAAGGGSTPSAGVPAGSFEAETIIKALDSRLKSLSKIDEAKSIPQKLGGF